MSAPKEPQPSQGAGAEEMAEAWIAEQREKRSRWYAMENCYRVDIGIVETWLAGHASGYSKGRASQDARIGELSNMAVKFGHERDREFARAEAAEKRNAELEKELAGWRGAVDAKNHMLARIEAHAAEARGDVALKACERMAAEGQAITAPQTETLGSLRATIDTLKAQLAAVKHDQECNERGLTELVDSLRASLALARGSLEKANGHLSKYNVIRAGHFRQEFDRHAQRAARDIRAALSQLHGVEKDGERGE